MLVAQEPTVVTELIAHVNWAIHEADQLQSRITPEVLAAEGMSSPRVRHLLNNLCSRPHTRYLEVGVWRGATFCAALCGNGGTIESAVAVDDFSEFRGCADAFRQTCELCLPDGNPAWILQAQDFRRVPHKAVDTPNVYFYDGDHQRQSQCDAIMHFWAALSDPCIFVVDDWQWKHVLAGTMDGLGAINAVVHKSWTLKSPLVEDVDAWWNGVFVAVLGKPRAPEPAGIEKAAGTTLPG